MRKTATKKPALLKVSYGPRTREKVALMPQRSNGRERVVLIMESATKVIYDRGFEAATMKEIAERSGTKIGSLYRFFPTKEILGDALIQRSGEFLETQWQAIVDKAPTITTDQLADLLLDSYVQLYEHNKVLPTMLESRANWSKRRLEIRDRGLERTVDAIKAHAPYLKRSAAKRIGVIMLYNMRAFNTLISDPTAPNAPGAINELRVSARIYLNSRLKPGV